MARPNLFAFATSELSQDAFFAWLISWADSENAAVDPGLHALGQDFVRLLAPEYQKPVKDVIVKRQVDKIDLLVRVNDDLVVVIEDKVGAKQHGNQLQRYKEAVGKRFKDRQQVFVYLKTLNESSYTLNQVEGLNYKVFSRIDVLAVLNAHSSVKHDVVTEYKNYLQGIENQSSGPYTLDSISSSWRKAEGFFDVVESRLKAVLTAKQNPVGWHYVSNPTGGFLCLWGLGTWTEDFQAYVQVENEISAHTDDVRVVVKIGDWEGNSSKDVLYELLEQLSAAGKHIGLDLIKPAKFRVGNTSTVAILQNPFKTDKDGVIDIDDFVNTLVKLGQVIADVV